ncbi:hypothetical protein ABT284_21730, partial [Nocardioides sp. NPDC000441]
FIGLACGLAPTPTDPSELRCGYLQPIRLPGNYYDDLVARFGLPDDLVATLRDLDLLYDRDADGEYLHCYTETVGEVFFELVERRDRYDGYGAGNAPVRLVSQAG